MYGVVVAFIRVDVTTIMWLGGWAIGWAMLWRQRPLPHRADATDAADVCRSGVSIVVPARNEADSLPNLLTSLVPQVSGVDEVVVVDDHSDDETAQVASRFGVLVTTPPSPPEGWLGKPSACWHGVGTTHHEMLLFVDADVTVAEGFLDDVTLAVEHHPDAVVSVQPWHEPGTAVEQLSLFFNVTALMGSGCFTIAGSVARRRSRRLVAFGPVMAIRRSRYMAAGGHANPAVRGKHTEDIALARAVGSVEVYSGSSVRFRMYPGGFGDLVAGWTRSLATGAWSAPLWASLAVVAWIWALSAAPFVAWWAWVAASVQVAVLARRAGNFSVVAAALYPIALAVFVFVMVRSAWRRITRRDVEWKGRDVPSR